jgi:short-subunit dehydrogenase
MRSLETVAELAKGIASGFAQAGAKVMIPARTQNDVYATAEEYRKFGNKVDSCAADGMKLSDLKNLVKQVSLLNPPRR